jgi:hypothetical protein
MADDFHELLMARSSSRPGRHSIGGMIGMLVSQDSSCAAMSHHPTVKRRVHANIAIIMTLLLLPYWARSGAHFRTIARANRCSAGVRIHGVGLAKTSETDASGLGADARSTDLSHGVSSCLPPSPFHSVCLACWHRALYLLLILPSNVYAAFQRVDFGVGAGVTFWFASRCNFHRLDLWFGVRQYGSVAQ